MPFISQCNLAAKGRQMNNYSSRTKQVPINVDGADMVGELDVCFCILFGVLYLKYTSNFNTVHTRPMHVVHNNFILHFYPMISNTANNLKVEI